MKTKQTNKSNSDLKLALKLTMICVAVLPGVSGAAPLSTSVFSDANPASSSGILSRLTFASGIEYSQRVAKDESSRREQSMDLTLNPGLKINDNLVASVRTVLTKESTGDQSTQSSDTLISLSIRGWKLTPEIQTLHSVSGILPTSVRSRENDRLQGGVSLSNGLRYIDPLWEISYRLGYSHFIHEFNLNADGSANVQQSISNSLGLQYKVTETFYLSTLSVYRWGQTYGKKERSSYEMHGDLNYDVSSKMTLNLGTSSAGQALKSNGVDSNITAFDSNTGIIRAGVSISL
jgi:hypothetical protein